MGNRKVSSIWHSIFNPCQSLLVLLKYFNQLQPLSTSYKFGRTCNKNICYLNNACTCMVISLVQCNVKVQLFCDSPINYLIEFPTSIVICFFLNYTSHKYKIYGQFVA